jgi:hypothetical protein
MIGFVELIMLELRFRNPPTINIGIKIIDLFHFTFLSDLTVGILFANVLNAESICN